MKDETLKTETENHEATLTPQTSENQGGNTPPNLLPERGVRPDEPADFTGLLSAAAILGKPCKLEMPEEGQAEHSTFNIQPPMPKDEHTAGLLAAAVIGGKPCQAEMPDERQEEPSTPDIQCSMPKEPAEGAAVADRRYNPPKSGQVERPPLSERKLEANRRNSLKSTGPKTVDGKAVVGRNALKYGALAKSVVVRGRIVNESVNEFKELCREFHDSLAPVGPLEEMLTGQIATATWRLRRVRYAEAGEIALSVDDGEWQRSLPAQPSLAARCGIEEDPVPALNNSKDGCITLIRWLVGVRAAVAADGELTAAALKIPNAGKPNRLSAELEEFWHALPARTKGGSAGAHRKEMCERMVGEITLQIEAVQERLMECGRRECAEENARRSATMLPSELVLEKILRYETALERQLFRAMNQLERLQRRRAGELVPAPVALVT